MAVTCVKQREIVEVPFVLPDGSIKPHPALVISREDLQDYEDGLFYAVLVSTKNHYPELTIPIKNERFNKPLSKKSYFVTHIVHPFNVQHVIAKYHCYIKEQYFDYVVNKIIENIIGE